MSEDLAEILLRSLLRETIASRSGMGRDGHSLDVVH